jgi:WD40 repeat protein
MKRTRAPADNATLFVTYAHRDISLEMMRSYVEFGDGGYWSIHAIAWSPDGRYWASAGADDTLRLWDAITAQQVQVYTWNRLKGKIRDVVWSPDSGYIGVLADGGSGHRASTHEVTVLNVVTGKEVYREAQCVGNELTWSVSQPLDPFSSDSIAVLLYDPSRTWSQDGHFFLASDDGSWGEQHRKEAAATVAPADAPTREWSRAGACNGRRITSGTMRIVDRESRQVKVSLARGTSLAAWSPARNSVASVRRKTISVWDVERGALLCAYGGHTGWGAHVTCLSWAPSGQHIASGDSTGAIHIWRVQEQETNGI